MRKLLALLLLIPGALASAQQIRVAAGADMSVALPALAESYTKGKHTLVVDSAFNASGTLTNQIRKGAPFDVFLSTDEQYAQQLIAEGLASKDTLYRFGVGRLVLWVPNGSPLDLPKLGIKALLDPSVKKISIENPANGPFGRAAPAALRHFGIYDKLASQFVVAENVSQAAQIVVSREAQVGLIALSLATAMKGQGRYWMVPPDAYPPLNQTAVMLSHSQQQEGARQFLDFLHSPEAASVLDSYGLSTEKH